MYEMMIQLVLLGALVSQRGCTADPCVFVRTSTNSRAIAKRTGQQDSYHPFLRHLSTNTPSGTWKQVGSDVDGESPGDKSGSAVAMSADGTRIVVGAPVNDGKGHYSGHARVFVSSISLVSIESSSPH